MKATVRILAGVLLAAIVAAGAFLWTPPPTRFDKAAAIKAAKAYDARIIRDKWGVPHIYGVRDADVAFGLAYAHAEDDWKTFEDVILFSRGHLAQKDGQKAAVTDFLIAALGANDAIAEKYETDLSPETHAMLKAYAAGLNFYCATKKHRCTRGVVPVTPQDIIAGFAARTPFFYGLDDVLKDVFAKDEEKTAALDYIRTAFLHLSPQAEIGSNAMAVAPARSADGATRLMVNSHQPYTGAVAWYEARVKSDEGWNMIGGLFPGSPLILHGASSNLGWAFTVNKPDLVDVYSLETNAIVNPTKYKFNGEWRDFEKGRARFRVKLWGPFSLPVNKATYRTVHGPAFKTPNGWRAVAFAGDGDIRAVEQWRRMNKAANFDEWQSAMALQGIASFNCIYADKTGRIAYYYNEAIPKRSPDWDWTKMAPGDRPDLVWKGVMPFGTAPHIVAPSSGYIVNANNEPWRASAEEDSPKAEDFPAWMGVWARSTNRGIREHELYGADKSITSEEFIRYKMDDNYAKTSNLRQLIDQTVAAPELAADADLAPAISVLKRWNGAAHRSSREAALAITFGRYALGELLQGDDSKYPSAREALAAAAADIRKGFGRLDPEWGEVNRLRRGKVDLPLDGGPDTLRAVYAPGNPAHGSLTAEAGDTYIMDVEWLEGGKQRIRTIHQFGAATLDKSSPHYADQAPLFANEEWKSPPMTEAALLKQATRAYAPGE